MNCTMWYGVAIRIVRTSGTRRCSVASCTVVAIRPAAGNSASTGAVERKGMTLVPLSVYFNGRGRAKVELALAKGKNAADKRQTTKEREWKREQGRLLREHG